MKTVTTIAKALSDRSRVRALACLAEGELCLCQIVEMLGLAPSTVSKHMAVLAGARLVRAVKRGRWHYYRLASGRGEPAVGGALAWVRKALADDADAHGDLKRLKKIRRMSKGRLTQCYRS